MQSRGLIPIWFFIGLLLLIYGVIIFTISTYHYFVPVPTTVVLPELHAGIWMGALLLIIGGIYTFRFYPRGAMKR